MTEPAKSIMNVVKRRKKAGEFRALCLIHCAAITYWPVVVAEPPEYVTLTLRRQDWMKTFIEDVEVLKIPSF